MNGIRPTDEFVNKINSEYEKLGLKRTPEDWSYVDQIINFTEKEISSLSPKQCAVISTILSQFCLAIQLKQNKTEAFINWCKNKIKNATGQDRVSLYRLLDDAELKKISLNFTTRRIETLGESYRNMSRI